MENLNIKNLEFKIRLLYSVWIVFAIFSVAYVPSLIFIQDDITSTAANVTEHEMLFRLSIIGSFATGVLMIYVSFYLYLLFEKVNKNTARLMLILALMSIPFIGFDVFKIVSLGSEDAGYIYNCLNISRNAQTVAEVFWGLWLFPLGKLVIASNYFPKFLGYALIAACLGYLFGVVIKVVCPDQSYLLFISDTLAFGELVFALWFVFRGLRLEQRFIEGDSGVPIS